MAKKKASAVRTKTIEGEVTSKTFPSRGGKKIASAKPKTIKGRVTKRVRA